MSTTSRQPLRTWSAAVRRWRLVSVLVFALASSAVVGCTEGTLDPFVAPQTGSEARAGSGAFPDDDALTSNPMCWSTDNTSETAARQEIEVAGDITDVLKGAATCRDETVTRSQPLVLGDLLRCWSRLAAFYQVTNEAWSMSRGPGPGPGTGGPGPLLGSGPVFVQYSVRARSASDVWPAFSMKDGLCDALENPQLVRGGVGRYKDTWVFALGPAIPPPP